MSVLVGLWLLGILLLGFLDFCRIVYALVQWCGRRLKPSGVRFDD